MSTSAIYKELKWLLSQTPSTSERGVLDHAVIDGFHTTVDLLSNETKQDFSRFKLDDNDMWDRSSREYSNINFRTKLGRLIGYIEGEFGLTEDASTLAKIPEVQISLVNNQTVAITSNTNIQMLIDEAKSKEEKEQLSYLKEEIEKPKKDWNKIKTVLIWALNFSEKLFFQLLPIILKHYGVS